MLRASQKIAALGASAAGGALMASELARAQLALRLAGGVPVLEAIDG